MIALVFLGLSQFPMSDDETKELAEVTPKVYLVNSSLVDVFYVCQTLRRGVPSDPFFVMF